MQPREKRVGHLGHGEVNTDPEEDLAEDLAEELGGTPCLLPLNWSRTPHPQTPQRALE